MEHDDAERVRLHLLADPGYQHKMVRFIENHDEPRAAAAFGGAKARAAAAAILTLTGARLLHEGQFEGRRVRLPVFLARRPDEAVDTALQMFYGQLLAATAHDVFRNGAWRLCDRSGWPDNASFRHVLAWCWVKDDERVLVVINYSGSAAQARVTVPWDELRGRTWRLQDALSTASYDRDGAEMRDAGLYVDLAPWATHVFALTRAA
jgi:hypothetical protein